MNNRKLSAGALQRSGRRGVGSGGGTNAAVQNHGDTPAAASSVGGGGGGVVGSSATNGEGFEYNAAAFSDDDDDADLQDDGGEKEPVPTSLDLLNDAAAGCVDDGDGAAATTALEAIAPWAGVAYDEQCERKHRGTFKATVKFVRSC